MKGWVKVITVVGLVVVGLLAGAFWVLREAFGPLHRTVEIDMGSGRTLIGHETYHGDFAAEFYDVDFSLADGDHAVIDLGSGTFSAPDWDAYVKLFEIGDWLVLPVADGPYAKILLTNMHTRATTDTIFFVDALRTDSLWKTKYYKEVPNADYRGRSSIASIQKNIFSIHFEYGIGSGDQSHVYSQMAECEMDSVSGRFITKEWGDRAEW